VKRIKQFKIKQIWDFDYLYAVIFLLNFILKPDLTFLLMFLCFSQNFVSQIYIKNNFSLGFGVNASIGSPINKIGFTLGVAYQYKAFAAHANTNLDFNLNHYGKRKSFLQSKNSVGVQFFGGKGNQWNENPAQVFARLCNEQFGLGYDYIWYLDNVGSSQRSGAFGLFIDKMRIYFENDIFAGQGSDRFRTGYVFAQYSHRQFIQGQLQLFHFQLGTSIWTGETRTTVTKFDSINKCNYKDLSQNKFGKTSHGILFLGFSQQLDPLYQIGFKLGVDSELVRNSFQNQLFHNLKFIPSKKINRTANYPMLDQNGKPIFDKKMRRKDKLFLIGGLNLD
jgi:hypothetical protein